MLLPMIVSAVFAGSHAPEEGIPFQYSFTLWNWDKGYRDIEFFRRQVDASAGYGFTRIELGAGWPDCEPRDGEFDFSMVDERVAYLQSKGLDIRLRVNVADEPAWFEPELFQLPDGTTFMPERGYPSVFSRANRDHQLRFVGALAEHFTGKGFTYTPGFSVHMEVKFAAWNTYEPSARKAFQDWLAGRYGIVNALNEAWRTDFADFGAVSPPVPQPTRGEPDLSPPVHDWIAFREWALGDWVRAFADAVQSNDPTAGISVPLGESYRRESAAFANLDYWGYSRPADEVVHSYDFFWHGPRGLSQVSTAVATMRGITLRPVILEIDGPYAIEHHGYTTNDYKRAGLLARDAGAAGVQVTNWGSVDIREQPWMGELGTELKKSPQRVPDKQAPQVLYYVSKWQNYCNREPDETLYERQFGLWTVLRDAGIPTRIVTDENLLHETILYDTLVIPYAPLVDAPVRERLRQLSFGRRMVADEPVGVFTATETTGGQFGAKIDYLDAPFPSAPDRVKALLMPDDEDRRQLRVAAVQFQTRFDVDYNTKKIVEYLHQAAAQHVQVVVFTEMALTGYSKHAEFGPSIDWQAVEKGLSRIRDACRELGLYAVVGAPTRESDALFCSAVTIGPAGTAVNVYEKTYLAGEAWATPGRHLSIFPVEGIRCGTFICHDERYAHLVQLRALAGAQLFFCISCESGLVDEHKIGPYRAQIQARAVENGVYIVHANTPARRDDLHAGDASHGQSRIVGPDGNLLVEASVDQDEMVVAVIDLRHAREGGMDAATTTGPTASWIRDGVALVSGR